MTNLTTKQSGKCVKTDALTDKLDVKTRYSKLLPLKRRLKEKNVK